MELVTKELTKFPPRSNIFSHSSGLGFNLSRLLPEASTINRNRIMVLTDMQSLRDGSFIIADENTGRRWRIELPRD